MIITVIATGSAALKDLGLLLFTVAQVYSPSGSLPSIYVYTDTASVDKIANLKYPGSIKTHIGLDAYTGLNRQQMERLPGRRYDSLFKDFTAEKITALRWTFEMSGEANESVWFLDTDIVLLAPLPTIPYGTDIALSPHLIRESDEAKYGVYNAGFMWFGTKRPKFILDMWEKEIRGSRFFEQAALEKLVCDTTNTITLPIQCNFGWWRMWQGRKSAEVVQNLFGFNRRSDVATSGLTYDGAVLQSIHTHFAEKTDGATVQFNEFILERLGKLGKFKQAAELVQFIKKNF